MNKIFLICPVRNADQTIPKLIVEALEAIGHTVYYPARDTNQDDDTGFNICASNRSAMRRADEVHVFWDGESQGCLFDMGMAFAMNKVVKIVRAPARTEGKSFQNMLFEWQDLPPTEDNND